MEPKNQPPAETLETNPTHGDSPPQPTSSKPSEPQVEVAEDDKVDEKPPDSPASEIQKKQRRAERFGVPVKLSEKEKRNSRAERFGTGPSLQTSSEEQKRKARAERFGSAGDSKANEEAKKKARLERFAQKTEISSVEEEKRKARAIRFSQPAANPASDTKETKLSTEETLSVDKAIGGT